MKEKGALADEEFSGQKEKMKSRVYNSGRTDLCPAGLL